MVSFFVLSLVLIGALVGSVGTILIKQATKSSHKFSLLKVVKSYSAWAGFSLYGISTIFYIFALRKEQLSIVYPLVATSYLWTTLFSIKYLGEKMNSKKWIGLMGIILGVILIGIGGS